MSMSKQHILSLITASGLMFALPASAQDSIQPVPAEKKELASKSLLLDVENIGSRFVAVGERGHILASKNGVDWVQTESPVRALLTAVDFVDDTHGWAVGHDAVILHTTDGGESWDIQNFDPKAEKPLLDVKFLDRNRGFAMGSYGHFYKTTDGGSTWNKFVRGVGFDDPVWDEFVYPGTENEDAVYELEDEMLDYTTAHINSMIELNNGNLLVVGEAGLVALSTDRGRTWGLVESPYEGSFFSAVPSGRSGAVIFGLRGNTFVSQGFTLPGASESDAADGDDDSDATADVATASAAPQAIEANWQSLELNTLASLQGGTALSDGSAIIVGLNGVIRQVSPNGRSVRTVSNPFDSSIASVIEQDGNLLLVGVDGAQVITR